MPFALIVGSVVVVVVFYLLAETVVRQVKARKETAVPTAAKDPQALVAPLRKELEATQAQVKTLLAQQQKLEARLQNLETIVSSVEWDDKTNPK
ncbi:MAG: hypothetical protein SFY70_03885 [Bacteroidia bacterium]|nr:hypothetical protein [Bacteroidia bacterium]